MSLNGRIDRLERKLGRGLPPLVICFDAPHPAPTPPADDRPPRLVCQHASGGLQAVPDRAQVIVLGLRPDGPQ